MEVSVFMNEFDICGTHILFSDIKDYQIVQREYIYRPAYKERQSSIRKLLSSAKYEFTEMIPYAAINVDSKENKHQLATKRVKEDGTVKGAVIKDVAVGVVSTIADKLNIKELKNTKYNCISISGRMFTTFLEDIPAVIIRSDGKISDVHKNDPIYPQLGETIAPCILIVKALMIVTKNSEYVFYGNGIQIDDVENAYNDLHESMGVFHSENQINRKNNKITARLGSIVGKVLPAAKTKLLQDSSQNDSIVDEDIIETID